MRHSNRTLLVAAGVVAVACAGASVGCELIASFDRSLIDAGVEADAGVDATTPVDANAPDTSLGDAHVGDAADATPQDAGCVTSSHCPVGQACDTTTGACTTTCSSTLSCNGTCCNGTTCEPGDAAAACGLPGSMCADCTVSDAGGAACVAATGSCGCATEQDCPVGLSCNGALHRCVTSCSPSQVCHGTCCNVSSCATETATTCGPAGGACTNCVTADAGAVCVDLPDGGAGATCGCVHASDCPSGFVCDPSQHACTTCGASSAASFTAVTETDSTAALPAFAGGSLVAGTYALTADTNYGAADNNPLSASTQLVWVLSSSGSGSTTVTADEVADGGVSAPSSGTLTPVASTTTLTEAFTCGVTSSSTVGYTVTATSPVTLLIQVAPGSNEVWTLTQQP